MQQKGVYGSSGMVKDISTYTSQFEVERARTRISLIEGMQQKGRVFAYSMSLLRKDR